MKKCFLVLPLLLLLFVQEFMLAQIPNAGFEDWTPATQFSPSLPVGWVVSYIPTLAIPVTQSATPHSGSFAIQGAVVDVPAIQSVYPPYLQTFFSYAQRPGMLTGYVAYTSAGRDTLEVFAALYKNSLGTLIAAGGWGTATNIGAYTKFSAPLEYYSEEAPDTAWIWVLVGPADNDTIVHLGTSFLLDDLAFEGTATAIDESPARPATFALHQNYPNPFNPATAIKFELPQASHVRLSVYNLLGQELAVLLNEERQPGVYEHRFDAGGLPSGTYFYRIQAGNFSQVRKMSLVK